MAEQWIPGLADDGSTYPIEKLAAHREGARHLAVSVFLFSGDELLIQRRADGKYHSGGLWANTCCSHPAWGEAIVDCAHRRLYEELGIAARMSRTTVLDYAADVGNGLREVEQVHLFYGSVDKTTLQLAPNPEEVSATNWMTLPALRRRMQTQPEQFSAWFKLYLSGEVGELKLPATLSA
ncbi:MAG: isopentenyl-diphosphate delta-isomerase [Granulosicoccaceae bacterium]